MDIGNVILARTCRALLCTAVLATTMAPAEPYRPAADTEVLQRLPKPLAGFSSTRERALRELVAARPDQLDLAVHLAQIEIQRSRVNADPRPLGRAEALLAPWWTLDNPPVAVLVLRASIRQHNHAFIAARADLEKVLLQDPGHAQAWFSLASVQLVTGDLAAARASCTRLHELASALVAISCEAAVDAVNGRADRAYAALDDVLARAAADNERGVRAWALTLQAEVAQRLARSVDAERLYRDSLTLAPEDSYARAAYADFLLDADRAEEVARLIAADTPNDSLLLRRALAATRLHAADAADMTNELAARFDAEHARGDSLHLREEARFALAIRTDGAAALALALANWQQQKEPQDARLVLESALAAGRPQAAADVIGWIEQTGLEGAALARLRREIRL